MKNVIKLFILGAHLLTCGETNAIYFVDDEVNPVNKREISGNKHLPDVCLIKTQKDGAAASQGSGVFVSGNVVLTARHVVCVKEAKPPTPVITRLLPPEKIKIYACGREFNVVETSIYEDGAEDFTLLRLDSSLGDVGYPWRKIEPTYSGKPMPRTVSVMGYGRGRVISGSKVFSQDIVDAYNEYTQEDYEPLFRFRENIRINKLDGMASLTFESSILQSIDAGEYGRIPELNLTSKYVRMECGDSGSPLLDGSGNIIGVCKGGNKAFSNTEASLIQEIREEYDRKIRPIQIATFLTGCGLPTSLLRLWGLGWHSALGYGYLGYLGSITIANQLISSSTGYRSVHDYLDRKTFEYIYTRRILERNAEILEGLNGGNKNFFSRFNAFDENAAQRFNEVIAEWS